ncbi:unnamed protein product [Rhizophagus irregularis]|nr:unnamed protein product [Rhizophagus irregularis]
METYYTSHTLLKRHYRFSCYKVLHNSGCDCRWFSIELKAINELSNRNSKKRNLLVEHNGLWEIGKLEILYRTLGTDLQIIKPIYWLPSLSTSLAEAELEYREQICLCEVPKWNTLKHLRSEGNQFARSCQKRQTYISSLESNVELYMQQYLRLWK